MGVDMSIGASYDGPANEEAEFRAFLRNRQVPQRLREVVPTDYFESESFGIVDLVLADEGQMRRYFDCESALEELSSWFPGITFSVSVDLFEEGREELIIRGGSVAERTTMSPSSDDEDDLEEDD